MDMDRKIKSSLLLTALAAGAFIQTLPARCASFSPPPSLSTSLPPPPTRTLPPPVTYTPPPPPPSISTPPPGASMPTMPVPTFNSPLNPKDVTDMSSVSPERGESGSAMRGIMTISELPGDGIAGNGDFLLVRGTPASVYHKDSPCSVKIESGDVLVSMRRPTRLGFAVMEFGKLALTGDADVMVSASHDMLRIINVSGRGESVKVKLDRGFFAEQNANVIALAPGYELVACSHTLGRSDVRRTDGFARRNFKIFEGRKIAVCEISTESVLTSSALISEMAHGDAKQERRVLNDMSKMAAVLNFINGPQGYERDGNEQVAHK